MSALESTEPFARRTPRRLAALLTPAQLRVAIALASYAGPDGRCWPSLRLLGRDLGRSPGSVAERLDELVELGVVVVDEHRPGRRRVLVCTWLPGAVIHNRAGEPRGGARVSRAHRAGEPRAGARVSRAEQDQYLDQEQPGWIGPTDEGRAILRAIQAQLGVRAAPAAVLPSEVGQARARRRYRAAALNTANPAWCTSSSLGER